MDCGGVLVKYVLFIFNILFVICGILIIVLGSIMVSKMSDFSNVEQAFNTNSVAIVLLVLGCMIFVISFLGCCGAIRENNCSLSMYSIFMLGLFLCQIAVIVYVWVQRPQIIDSIDKVVYKVWEQRAVDQPVLDAMQRSFKCCGYYKFTDYGSMTLPASCCDSTGSSCNVSQVLLTPGCKSAVESFWDKNVSIIKYAGLGVAAIELTAFIFACCLANQIRNNGRRSNF
ncbi:CD63 antigen-like [Scaptodrosophila lebanonensis]|uniref:Tetraspanin n=1 Tax=Drosophila lebanonensis TaxID=7225 RepID=A0A6J2UIU7_DROLE|nr:CD63 antigen-like [Scaptodrosophila lebanonensis]